MLACPVCHIKGRAEEYGCYEKSDYDIGQSRPKSHTKAAARRTDVLAIISLREHSQTECILSSLLWRHNRARQSELASKATAPNYPDGFGNGKAGYIILYPASQEQDSESCHYRALEQG